MGEREGPAIHITVDCRGCVHLQSKYYCVEDGNDCDSGFSCRCTKVDRHVGDDMTRTPNWCPLLPAEALTVRVRHA